MQAELGFTVRGTTDAALVKRHLNGPVAGVLEIGAEEVSSSSGSEHGQVQDQLENLKVHKLCSKL